MNLGLELTTNIHSLAYGGEGIVKHEGMTGFVYGALPGELVRSRVIEIKKNYFRSQLLEIIEPSPFRIIPRCPYFGRCGGCVYQHLSFEKQLEIKSLQLQELLKRISKIREVKISHIVPSPKSYNYRNQITIKLKKGQLGYIGIDNKKFVPIEECPIAKEPINIKLKEMLAKTNGEIIIKCGADGTVDLAFLESISQKGGYKILHEKIGDKIYYFSLSTFFQVNPYILPAILSQLKSILNLTPDTMLFDLYCGTGLFSIYLGPHVKSAYGIEVNPTAVKLAQKSTEDNNIKNCHFCSGKAEILFPDIYRKHKGNKNILLLDPTRQGLSEDMLRIIGETPLDQLLYISCEPSILARDLKSLYQNGYQVRDIIIADMFPQTKYMETLAVLSKTKV